MAEIESSDLAPYPRRRSDTDVQKRALDVAAGIRPEFSPSIRSEGQPPRGSLDMGATGDPVIDGSIALRKFSEAFGEIWEYF